MAATAITRGDVLLHKHHPKHLEPITAKMRAAGCVNDEYDDSLRIRCDCRSNPSRSRRCPIPAFPLTCSR